MRDSTWAVHIIKKASVIHATLADNVWLCITLPLTQHCQMDAERMLGVMHRLALRKAAGTDCMACPCHDMPGEAVLQDTLPNAQVTQSAAQIRIMSQYRTSMTWDGKMEERSEMMG